MTKRNINIELEDKNYEILRSIAHSNHRTIKATVEMVTLEYIKNNIELSQNQ